MKLLKLLRNRFRLTRALVDRFVEEGRVFIGRKRVDNVHLNIPEDAPVVIDGASLLLNKPPGYVVSRSEKGSPVIYDILPSGMLMLNPIGRLDKDSSGLILMTIDGLLQHRLTHPRYGVLRGYVVLLDRKPDRELFSNMVSGLRVGNDFLRAIYVRGLVDMEVPSELQHIWMKDVDLERAIFVDLAHGKYREIRRLLGALGYGVHLLRRVYYASIKLDVPEGEWRLLSPDEVLDLMRYVGLYAP